MRRKIALSLVLTLTTAGLLHAAEKVGEIVSIEAKTLTIAYGDETWSFKISPSAKVDDLKIGDAVQIHYTTSFAKGLMRDRRVRNIITIVVFKANPCHRFPKLPQCQRNEKKTG
jgi:hypothetical protein